MSEWRWPWAVYLACFLCLATGLAFGIGICELRHREEGELRIDLTYADGKEVYDCVIRD